MTDSESLSHGQYLVSSPSSEDRWSGTDISFTAEWMNECYPGLWFEDGNVIINTYDHLAHIRYQYRVHRSILLRHSVWWRAMFAFVSKCAPQGTPEFSQYLTYEDDADSTFPVDPFVFGRLSFGDYQGGPVDGVYPVEAGFSPHPDVFAALLRRVYLVGEDLGSRNDAQANHRVHSLIRLAHNYGMESIRSELLLELSKTWPLTLDDWDHNESQTGAILCPPLIDSPMNDQDGDTDEEAESEDAGVSDVEVQGTLSPRTTLDLPDPVLAIAIARECALTSILPCAFYTLSRIPWHRITEPTFNTECHRITDGVNLTALSQSDMLRICTGRGSMQASARRFAVAPTMIDPAESGCIRTRTDPGNLCNDGVKRFWSRRVRSIVLTVGMDDPLGALRDLADGPLDHYGVCLRCEAAVKAKIRGTRESWWSQLSSFFMLSGEV